MKESGSISIHADNILPIIKQWLYSEKDIFIRELVSNAADAITKINKLISYGEAKGDFAEPKITIKIDKDKKTLSITDTGLGMTADEVKKYINQVAFSGVRDFMEKYKDKDDKEQVIGHFGLGFYSAFMPSTKVEIDTLSFKEGAKGVNWTCDGSTEFHMKETKRTEVGTTITLHIADDSKEMLEETKVQELLKRYCAFIRYPIEISDNIINETVPLWAKSPSTIKDEEYKEFYYKLFPTGSEPLFWIHLNIEFPFNLKGILYFPKLKHELDASQGEVKLYCNQVYVADNTKELIPEFLTLLKGTIDCPDLPLNVSRSFLQNDSKVSKISEHISKKVADKLVGLAKNDKELYESYWNDISPFIKFGMVRDEKFYKLMQDYLIFENTAGGFTNIKDYLDSMKDTLPEKTLIYCSNKALQSNYITMLKEQSIDVLVADTMIDGHLIGHLEMKNAGDYKFVRVDADLSEILNEKSVTEIADPRDNKTTSEKVVEIFEQFFKDHADKIEIKAQSMKSTKVPAIIIEDENMRRIKDMGQMSGLAAMQSQLGLKKSMTINVTNPAVKNLVELSRASEKGSEVKLMIEHIYDIALIQQGDTNPDIMKRFIERSTDVLGYLSGATSLDSSPKSTPDKKAKKKAKSSSTKKATTQTQSQSPNV